MSNLATITNNILADSGIDDINVVVTTGSYSNPAWITAFSWTKITDRPTTLAGYGITDAYTQTQVNNLLAGYLPLTGGTLTGPLVGTSASFSGNVLLNTSLNLGSVTVGNSILTTDSKFQHIRVSVENDLAIIRTDWFSGAGGAQRDLSLQYGLQERIRLSSTGISVTGEATLSNLAGSGTRMVVANASGVLSTQAITTPVTGTGTTNYHAKWVSGSSIGNSLILDDGTNIGINTTSLTKNINFAGTTRHERIYAYGNYSFNFSNAVGETFTWFRLGNATAFSQTRIFYRAGTFSSEEEGEIKISNTCVQPFIEWTRNTYSYHVREVRGRMTGGCGQCEVWVLVRHGNYNAGPNTNFQWQINGGTDSEFAVVNAIGTPGTGTNTASINSTDSYFYNNSGNMSIAGRMSIGTTSPVGTANLFIEGTSIVVNTEGSNQAKSIYFRFSDGADIRSDSYLTFSTGSTPSVKSILTSTGNFGINTLTPQRRLDVISSASNVPSAAFGRNIAIGEWAGLEFGFLEEGNSSYRKSALVFERIDASARGTIHILNNNDADTSSASLANSRLSITSVGLVTIPNLAGSGTRMVVANASGALSTQAITVGTVTSVAALTLGTSGTDLSSTVANGTTTPVITLNVPTASAANRGALSAADWTTFNNKQNALTNPVTGTGTTNFLPKFTGSTTVGNSQIFDNGSNVGIFTTPQLWTANRQTLQVGNTVALSAGTAWYPFASFLGNNVYNDSSDTPRYIASSGASVFYFNAHNGGNFLWQIAAPGTAGNAISFTTAMTLNASGQLGIGTATSPAAELQVGKASEVTIAMSNSSSVTSGNRGTIAWYNSAVSTVANIRAAAVTDNVGTELQFFTRPVGGSLTQVFTLASTGAANIICRAPDADRTLPVNVLTLTAEQGNAPYGPFGGSILFRNRSYVSGLVNSARIRSVIYDDGAPANFGGGLWFETTPTPGGTLTPSLIIDYLGRVGIGTAPSERLSVSGNIAASGYLYTTDRLYITGNTTISNWISGSLTAGYSSTNSYGWVNGAGALVLGANGTESIRVSGGNVGINTDAPNRNLTVFGTTRHERIYGYRNNVLSIPNSIPFGTVWVHLGSCGAFTTDKIYYRVATNTSEEEGEITISNTCSLPFVQWQRNTYNPMVVQVKARMTGGCGQTQVWLLIRYGTDFTGASTNLQWQAYNGTDSGFSIVNAIGTPGTGTNEKNIVGSEGYFYANSGSIMVADNIGIATTAPSAKLHIDSALGNDAIRISDTTGSVRMSIGQESSYTGNYINTRNIDMKLQTYLAGGSGGNIIFQTQSDGSASLINRMRIRPDGEIWMGFDSDQGAYRLQVNGSTYSSSGFFEASDIRLKTVLNRHQSVDFDVIEYKWNDGKDSKLHWGYAAQEVMKLLPDAVSGSENTHYTLDYNQVHTYKIAMLEKRIVELEQQLKNK